MEVTVQPDNGRKRARKCVSVPVPAMYREELSDIYMLTEIPKYENVNDSNV
jgi:hypothetical protein